MKESYAKADVWKLFKIEELIPVTDLSITMGAITDYGNGEKQVQFIAHPEPADASLKEYVFWETNQHSYIYVDNHGLATIKFHGTDPMSIGSILAKTIYPSGGQGFFEFWVDGDDIITRVDDISADNPDGRNEANDIYNAQGICIKRGASQADINCLQPGFYIISGKKIFVK